MLQQVVHIIIISVICIIWGLPVYFFLSKKGLEKYWYSGGTSILIFLFFSGLLSLALLSSWLVLFVPLKINYLLTATVALLLVLLLFFRKSIPPLYKNLDPLRGITVIQYIFIASCILLFTLLGTLKPVNIDTQLYHLQIIRWTNEYGTVPGLSNLYPRLGLGSNWFNLISLFHIPAFNHQNFTFLNTTVTIWFLLWLIGKWRKSYLQNNNKQYSRIFSLYYFLLLLYFLYDWQLFRDTANSTSYDFIVTALTTAVISFIAEEFFSDKKNDFSFIVIILSLLIIPFKLSGIFILIPVFLYLLHFRKLAIWAKSFLAGCIILFPLLARNYITTGYPLYPSTLSPVSPEWQMPGEMALKFKEYIFYANKFYNQPVSFILNYNKTAFNWIPFWTDGILLKHKILFLLSGLSLLLLFYTPVSKANHTKFRLFIFSLWLMLAAWFFTAPDPRFAFGFLLFLSFFPISVFFGKYISFSKIAAPALALLSLLVLIYTARKSGTLIKHPAYLVYVVNTDSPPFKKINVNNSIFHVPEKINDSWNNRCFFIPLPCLCEENPFLQLRGSHIRKGFLMKPQPDSIFIRNYNY